MAQYRCKLCGFIYDEEAGDDSLNAPAGTTFDKFPASFNCPKCGVNKSMFEKVE